MSDKKVYEVVFHTVKRNETLAYIAYINNTTIDNLIKLNRNLDKDCLYIGQKIRVKATPHNCEVIENMI